MRTPGLRHWLIEADTKVAGLTSLQADLQQDDVEISIFGLIPDFVGRAHSGHALTLSTRLAWNHEDVHTVRRAWLHTSTLATRTPCRTTAAEDFGCFAPRPDNEKSRTDASPKPVQGRRCIHGPHLPRRPVSR